MSTISSGTTSSTALVLTPDITGTAVLNTNGGTTALTLGATQAATFAGNITLPANSTSAAPLTLSAASTTPNAAGGLGQGSGAFYGYPNASTGAGIIPSLMVYRLTATNTFSTFSISPSRSLFNVGCNIDVASYMMEMWVWVTRTSTATLVNASNINFSTSLGTATCTFTGIAECFDTGTTTLTQGTISNIYHPATNISSGSVRIASTAAVAAGNPWGFMSFTRGVVTCSVAGTFTPTVNSTAAISDPVVVRIGSYIILRRLGAVTSGNFA